MNLSNYFFIFQCLTCIVTSHLHSTSFQEFGIQESWVQGSWRKIFDAILTTFHQESPDFGKHESKMIQGLNAFVKSLDDHGAVLKPEDYRQLKQRTKGEFFRTGITVGPKGENDTFLMVLSVKKGSPAAQAGIQRYDSIQSINETPIGSLPLEESIKQLIHSKSSSPLRLLIARPGQKARSYTINPTVAQTKSCRGHLLLDHATFYCSITLFTQHTAAQLHAELTHNVNKKTKGIIIDLRNNPGGLLHAAIECAALFVEKHSLIVSTKNLRGEIIAHYRTQSHPLIKTTPLVLLVNTATASAAEIFAQALRLYAQQTATKLFVTIVGTPTAGKGSFQRLCPLPEKYALKITTGFSCMSDGKSFHKQGILPDFILSEHQSVLIAPPSQTFNPVKQPSRKKLQDFRQMPLVATPKQTTDPLTTCACSLIALLSHAQTSTPHLVSSYSKKLSWLQSHYIAPQTLPISLPPAQL